VLSPYIPDYVGNQQPIVSVASASHSPAAWALPAPPPLMAPTLSHNQQLEGHRQVQQQHDTREESEARTVNNTVPESKIHLLKQQRDSIKKLSNTLNVIFISLSFTSLPLKTI
jgi:hypothetical protein